ncbi:L,D-transpeptidase family protein [Nocardioides sp. cx-173]|uniref:L,D-transpeptidase family protein n=1 Tax=Nocardioides sp. cx-173 TaxID=2898796 RepID=UPI001E5E830C|nr:L,D-transpeptidase family protein [Nocardioides sp. cx-173]MCD4524096.1 L,D-transpeptidase family protein [Nocardioides sp. cx-173]UGB41493.1 L,D-transpeptidase family protein [Nocardioides sp. cx-173]
MLFARRLVMIVVAAALLSGAALGVGWASRSAEAPRSAPRLERPVETPLEPARRDPTPSPQAPAPSPQPEVTPEPPALRPGPRLLGSGDEGDRVRDLQARLRQIDWFEGDVTGFYGDVTVAAVRGFQAKREIPVTGEVDRRTLGRLHGMTTSPTAAELANQLGGNTPGALDRRCLTGRVLCIDKTSSTLRWVVDGRVLKTMDARFGGAATPTREGLFQVTYKSRDHVSSLYETSMPFAMFFSRGQAVHYSPDFAAVGYDGASHGCVNIRDHDGVAWLYDQVRVGDEVVVYRS